MQKEIVKSCQSFSPASKLLILGAGFSGQRIASIARAQGIQVICSRRQLNSPGADFVFDSNQSLLNFENNLQGVTHLLSCIPPTKNGQDPVLIKMLDYIKEMPLEWVGYLSTTGVYGDSKGEWVSEKNLPNPQQPRSQRRLACEEAWQNSGLPIQILRLPGIYGPGRSALESIQNSQCKIIEKQGQVFSRIHVDDIAGATFHLINKASQGIKPSVVNISDNLPTPNKDVLTYAAKLLKKPLPPKESFEVASSQMSPMAQSFWQENRRICNNLLCNELGYSLIHPDYKSGLNSCFQEIEKSQGNKR